MEKATVAGTSPKMAELVPGKTYAWCACGKSENQIWCNGAHKGSNFGPKLIQVDEVKEAAICTCKQTKNPPYCDGSHMVL